MNHTLALQATEIAPCGQVVLDDAGTVVLWNRWMQAKSDIDESDALGRTLDALFGDAVSPRLATAITSCLEKGSSRVISPAFTPHPLPLRNEQFADRLMFQSTSIAAITPTT